MDLACRVHLISMLAIGFKELLQLASSGYAVHYNTEVLNAINNW